MLAALRSLTPTLREKEWAVQLAERTALLSGDYAGARALLLRHAPTERDFSGDDDEFLGWALRGLGDQAAAAQHFRIALQQARTQAATVGQNDIRHRANILSLVGLREALAGEERDALRDSERAVEMLPFEADAIDGAAVLDRRIATLAILARGDESIAALERLLSRPSRCWPGDFWLDPRYASLRHDARFRALLARRGVDVNTDLRGAR